jgi:hypothetical protein
MDLSIGAASEYSRSKKPDSTAAQDGLYILKSLFCFSS